MKYIIHRFEGDIAICETANGSRSTMISKALLPEGAREGSAITYSDKGKYALIDDSKRINLIAAKMRNILKK